MNRCLPAALFLWLMLFSLVAEACTRCVYLGPNNTVMVARSMDWVEDPGSEVWVFPRGMKRNGAAGPGSIACWTQYVLDSFATVKETVAALERDPFTILAPILPNGEPAVGHMAISDPTGDSVILEYVKGKLVIHHGREFQAMTNSPIFDQQLALDAYWREIGGLTMLPGTSRAADRFARTSF